MGKSITFGEENYGPLLRLPCPGCDKVHWFDLVRHTGGFRIFGFTLSKAAAWSLHCETCNYPVDLSPDDAEKAHLLLPVSRDCYERRISEAQHLIAIQGANLQILHVLAKANTTWKCPQCGEESPNTLSECWNCGNDASEQERGVDSSCNDMKTAYLDRALEDHGNNPYGGLKL